MVRERSDHAPGDAPVPDDAPGPSPDQADDGDGLGDTARRLYEEGEAVARSAWRTLDALQSLAGHEAALARAALPQAAMFAGLSLALGLAAWLYLMALLVAWLHLWMGWAGALAVATGLSVLAGGLSVWRCLVLLKMSRFEITRRELRKLKRALRPGAPSETGA